MQVRVKLFATLRQSAGWSEATFELPDGASVNDLITHLNAQFDALDLSARTLYAAVNQTYAEADETLKDGDTVALFPPVSGGCR